MITAVGFIAGLIVVGIIVTFDLVVLLIKVWRSNK